MKDTTIEKLRRMVGFFNSVDEVLNDQITSLRQAEAVYDAAQKHDDESNSDAVRRILRAKARAGAWPKKSR